MNWRAPVAQDPLRAGLAELPAGVAATVFGVLAGVAVRYWSQRGVLSTGLVLVGVAMASMTLISPSTGYPQLGIALFVVGVGLGLAFTAASDLIIASVMPERAGAAAAVSETAYELGTALGIATLGSIITAVYRGLPIPAHTPDAIASHARDSLAAATVAARNLPADTAHDLLTGARPPSPTGWPSRRESARRCCWRRRWPCGCCSSRVRRFNRISQRREARSARSKTHSPGRIWP
jgi:MFS transporter, DHA2 family, multidrug resistance protein